MSCGQRCLDSTVIYCTSPVLRTLIAVHINNYNSQQTGRVPANDQSVYLYTLVALCTTTNAITQPCPFLLVVTLLVIAAVFS